MPPPPFNTCSAEDRGQAAGSNAQAEQNTQLNLRVMSVDTALFAPSDYEHIFHNSVNRGQTKQAATGELSDFVVKYVTDFINRQEKVYSR